MTLACRGYHFGDFFKDSQHVIAPLPDCAILEVAGGYAVPLIVKSRVLLAILTTMGLQCGCLDTRHVGMETATKQHAWFLARNVVVGDCRAVCAC